MSEETPKEDLDAQEEALSLDDLDQEMDAALDGMAPADAGPSEDELAAVPSTLKKLGGNRSPILSVVVTLLGVFLLWSMWADFRYWVNSDDAPRDLASTRDIFVEGSFTEDFDNQYVVLEGTPDVQHAARMRTEGGYTGYLRIVEAEGALFAAIPREDQRAPDQFDARFQGRMRRLSELSNGKWVQQFFDAEEMMQIVEVDAESFVDALAGEGSITVPTIDGESLKLTADDRIRLVVESPDAMVQLGKRTWRTLDDARAAVEALGLPFVQHPGKHGHYHAFMIRADRSELETLAAKLNEGHEIPTDNSDPKLGAMVLPRSSTFVVSPDVVGPAGEGRIGFEYGDNKASPGYDLKDGQLVPRVVDGGKLAVEASRLSAVRVERPIRVDPEGYVIAVGEHPSGQRLEGLLFLIVLGLMAVNVTSLVATRRRSA